MIDHKAEDRAAENAGYKAPPHPRKLWGDLETFSDVPITSGVHRYAERAEVLLFAWAIDNGPVHVEDLTAPGAALPAELREALADPLCEVWFQNSHFDRTVLRHALPSICPPPARWRDTMVQAMAHGLPGALGALCEVLRVPSDKAKDKAGKALIQLFCKPPAANLKRGRATRDTHPAEWAKFIDYAALDIVAMREVHRRLPAWNYQGAELALWHLDQRINDRGVAVDLALAQGAVDAVAAEQIHLRARTAEMTSGEVQAATQRDAMLAHILAEYGIQLPDMRMATIERRIADPDLPDGLRELLKVRLQASTTSTSKYKTLMRSASSDGRLRGLLQFCGATRTGRWAGRIWQPQNLPRPTLEQEEIDQGIAALCAGCADLVVPDVMRLTSSAIRGCIVAPPGRKLVVADLSNIEGRVLAWLAGEDWKLKAFADYDAGTGHDLYKLAYGKSFGVAPESVTKDQRQVGKVQELALGYEGGVGAFVTFAAAYGIDLEELADRAAGSIPGTTWGQANIMLDWHRDQKRDPPADLGLSDRAWLTCESFKAAWRSAHPAISRKDKDEPGLWLGLDMAVRCAIAFPGQTFPCRMLKARRDGNWLRIVLPSGRTVCYPSPAISEKDEITYMGVGQYSRKWERQKTYGGKLVENVTQAVARDVMAANMQAIQAAGYDITLTVHDEIIAETPDTDQFTPGGLADLLATVPGWAPGLPLAAAGFEALRYKKE